MAGQVFLIEWNGRRLRAGVGRIGYLLVTQCRDDEVTGADDRCSRSIAAIATCKCDCGSGRVATTRVGQIERDNCACKARRSRRACSATRRRTERNGRGTRVSGAPTRDRHVSNFTPGDGRGRGGTASATTVERNVGGIRISSAGIAQCHADDRTGYRGRCHCARAATAGKVHDGSACVT